MPLTLQERQVFWLKAILFVLAALPAVYLATALFLYLNGSQPDALGVNPAEKLSRATGDWALRLLLMTLLITPLRRVTGMVWLIRLRRMLGLFAFFYVCLHLAIYLGIDQTFDWRGIVKDIAKRPYITVGFTAFVLLIPLAVTSTNTMVRRLGGARWRRLHQLVYIIAPLGLIHFWWLVKSDYREPVMYTAIYVFLMLMRLRKPKGASTRS